LDQVHLKGSIDLAEDRLTVGKLQLFGAGQAFVTSNIPLIIEIQGDGIVRLVLNRPDKLNALSVALLEALREALATVSGNDAVRCVVISGNGRAFCAGHDLAEMRTMADRESQLALFSLCSSVMQAIVACPVPVIAQVHGIATAAGCQLAASCDLAIAASSARFAVSGINVGLFCSTPAVALSRAVGPKQAFDMLFTGEFISAAKAAEIGLISEVVDDGELERTVAAKTAVIASKDLAAVRYGKTLFQRQRGLALPDAYALASSVMADNMMEPDTRERIDAFVEKRRPNLLRG
jgi:enoyl-CoA hydratase/carnithine racemase